MLQFERRSKATYFSKTNLNSMRMPWWAICIVHCVSRQAVLLGIFSYSSNRLVFRELEFTIRYK